VTSKEPLTIEPTASGDPAVLVAAAAGAVGALVGVDWSRVERGGLVATLVGVERVRSMLDAVTVALVGRVEATRAGEVDGWASTADLVTAVSGGVKGSGPALVRLATRLADLPATRAGLAEGWLSRAKASVVACRVTSLPRDPGLRTEAEGLLLESAASLDAAELDRSWPRVLEQLDPDGTRLGNDFSVERRERDAQARRHLAMTPDRHGGVRWSGYSTIEDAETVKATLIPLTAPEPTRPGACGGVPPDAAAPGDTYRERRGTCVDPVCDHDGRDRRDGGTRLLDALVTLCRHAQAQAQARAGRGSAGDEGCVPADHGAPPRMIVTTTLEAIRAGLARARAGMPLWQRDPATGENDTGIRVGGTVHGLPLSVAAVRRMACDAEILPAVLGAKGQVLDLGRSQRLVSTGLWHALVLRDGGCAFPGCGRLPVACDAHHIRHWAEGGPTSLSNLALLCRRHHSLIHTSPWQVRINLGDGRPEFRPPGGPHAGRWMRQRRPRDLLADTG
jgi:hypothetical protein